MLLTDCAKLPDAQEGNRLRGVEIVECQQFGDELIFRSRNGKIVISGDILDILLGEVVGEDFLEKAHGLRQEHSGIRPNRNGPAASVSNEWIAMRSEPPSLPRGEAVLPRLPGPHHDAQIAVGVSQDGTNLRKGSRVAQ
jgi:hypothetical protein